MKIQGKEVTNSIYNSYISDSINKIFKILPIYEEAIKNNDLQNYNSYIEKLIVMFIGSEDLFHQRDFLSLVSILEGMKVTNLDHSKVKSLVFHCITILERIKAEE